ncbi:uncharacterized protein BDCG_00462 [Blastomyces dermatitidis ER-3]|uniref:Uncharacterized protein n=1 Tax=Ajellomyces dermatitidis (strain ER-3 / ATCC MYA-2586) TaxID=559297 RepID=A0ABP2EKJ1_AJEDR|nr:uncharacterized protein BDCG_00462 [Blastomyces dermatitidis ER-3]EEQ83657.2 hypothetical protein BDCG_00462 [Blastomyces dermatitidis ER-3]
MMMRRAENKLNADELTGRRNDTSLQDMAITAAAAREAEEDVTIRAVLSQLITVTVFNLAFLIIMETAAAS